MYVGDDGTPWSNSLTLGTVSFFQEGGFINLDSPLTGRYLVIRRLGPGIGGSNDYSLAQIKAYSVTNLLYQSATILEAPTPNVVTKSAQNLVENLRTRTQRNIFNPLIDMAGNRASFESCFLTTDLEMASYNHQYVLGFDLQKPMMIHAVLVAQDQFNGQSE